MSQTPNLLRQTEVELRILKIFHLTASHRALCTLKQIVLLLVLLLFGGTMFLFSLYLAWPMLIEARAAAS